MGGFLQRFPRRAIGDLMRGGINAAATPNIAGGGATDFFRSMQNAQSMQREQEMQDFAIEQQMRRAAMEEQMFPVELEHKQALADFQRNVKPEQVYGNLALGQQNADERRRTNEENERLKKENIEFRERDSTANRGSRETIATNANTNRASIAEMGNKLRGALGGLNVDLSPIPQAQLPAKTQSEIAKNNAQAEQAKRGPAGGAGGGTFVPLTDDRGQVVGFYNAKTDELRKNPIEGSRRNPVPVGERAKVADLQVMLEDAATLGQLGEKHQKHIGVIQGRLDDVQRKTLGVDESINDMFRIADNLADKLLRARSGAAITEGEFVRLRGLMPDPRSPYVKFKSDLRLFQSETQRTLDRLSGGGGTGSAPPPAATHVFVPGKGIVAK